MTYVTTETARQTVCMNLLRMLRQSVKQSMTVKKCGKKHVRRVSEVSMGARQNRETVMQSSVHTKNTDNSCELSGDALLHTPTYSLRPVWKVSDETQKSSQKLTPLHSTDGIPHYK